MTPKDVLGKERDADSVDRLSGEFRHLRTEFSRIAELLEKSARSAGQEAAERARKAGDYVWVEPEAGATGRGFGEPAEGEIPAPIAWVEKPLERVQELFGGRQMLGQVLETGFDAHQMLDKGLKSKALVHIVQKQVKTVAREAVLKAIGMSERTYQRHKKTPNKPVSPDQSGRAWKFAEVLAEATRVMGSQELAEEWLEHPAVALNRRRPIDLLSTPAGTEMVVNLLGRLRYGVYT
jgi:putative toxin-antitoxin system antitoxin component (TIGR02293 family)